MLTRIILCAIVIQAAVWFGLFVLALVNLFLEISQ